MEKYVTSDYMKEKGWPYENTIEEIFVGESRWGTLYDYIVADDDGYTWQFAFEVGSGDTDYDSFGFVDEFLFKSVSKVEVVSYEWREY